MTKPTPGIPPPPAWLAGALLAALLGLYCINRLAPLLASTMGVGPMSNERTDRWVCSWTLNQVEDYLTA